MISPLISWPEIAAGNPRFRRMYRSVPMISTEGISLPKDRRCLRFKCNSFYELNAVNTSRVHDLSAVNDCILRFKYSSTSTLHFFSSLPITSAFSPSHLTSPVALYLNRRLRSQGVHDINGTGKNLRVV